MDRTVKEIDATVAALKREGKVDKDTLDWFKGDYRRIQEQEGKRQRQEGIADEARR
jgi:hypothetical protein